jgi:hypothetical protein
MDHGLERVLSEEPCHQLAVADVALHEGEARLVLHIISHIVQIGTLTSGVIVGIQVVQRDHTVAMLD